MHPLLTALAALAVSILAIVIVTIARYAWMTYSSPLRNMPGPDSKGIFGSHLGGVLHAERSPRINENLVKNYGKNVRIRGLGVFDDRLLTFDPVAMSHVLNRTTDYQKPWQSRVLIESLIGCGLLAAEGNVHKRQRRVSNVAFSNQNIRAFIPLVFSKAEELRDRWASLISSEPKNVKLDVCHWISRATFDIIGLAGFDYKFDSIQDETNEVYLAYKNMFEVAISSGQNLKSLIAVFWPPINKIWPDERSRMVEKCREIIHRVGMHLVQEKKKGLEKGANSKDLLSLLLKANASTGIPEEQRISDEDILNQISTFLFAGSDTTSLALTWTLYLITVEPQYQERLRAELLTVEPIPGESVHDLYARIEQLPFLDNVVKESLRLIPPVHSSIRVAMKDDEIPVSEAVKMRDGTVQWGVKIAKGQFVHVGMQAFNLDRGAWGEDAWEFKPDRWDNLPQEATEQPGLYSNTMTFSAGPRACIGLKLSIIEMKVFLYMLVSSFVFSDAENVWQNNVVLTRPYVRGKAGSQCPLVVKPVQKPAPSSS